jgi:hypothetical protein
MAIGALDEVFIVFVPQADGSAKDVPVPAGLLLPVKLSRVPMD